VGHERIFNGLRPDRSEIEYVLQVERFIIENVGSFSDTNGIIRSLVNMCYKLLQKGDFHKAYHVVHNMQLLKVF